MNVGVLIASRSSNSRILCLESASPDISCLNLGSLEQWFSKCGPWIRKPQHHLRTC
jgi:hypothetical protein